jgi:hypothetical protein
VYGEYKGIPKQQVRDKLAGLHAAHPTRALPRETDASASMSMHQAFTLNPVLGLSLRLTPVSSLRPLKQSQLDTVQRR